MYLSRAASFQAVQIPVMLHDVLRALIIKLHPSCMPIYIASSENVTIAHLTS